MKPRQINIVGNIAYITLTKGYVATVDAQDVDFVSGLNWSSDERLCKDGSLRTVYAVRAESKKRIYLHRVITQCPKEFDVDHIDGNGLNNVRSNLRIVTAAQNIKNQKLHVRNTSGFRGVDFDKKRNKWRAKICSDGKHIHVGYFKTIEEAVESHKKACIEFHKEFARIK